MFIFSVFLISFLICLIFTPAVIHFARKQKAEQNVRLLGPDSHQKKNGTPTLGGVSIIFTVLIVSLFVFKTDVRMFSILTLVLLGGLVGFLDDFLKVKRMENLGLTSKQKLFGQIISAISFLFLLTYLNTGSDLNAIIDTSIHIPYLNYAIELNGFYFLLAALIIIGTSNATNLTDGLDGLLTSTSFIAYSTFGIIALHLNEINIALFCFVFSGALLGFLLFNKNPAKIFMGDTGSLAIGSGLAGVAILLKLELLLVLVGGVFVLETLSVIIQVSSFKLRQKRIFKMSPLHHHYELKGHSEITVVKGFTIAGLLFSLLSLITIMYF